jgi:hypothetical protein
MTGLGSLEFKFEKEEAGAPQLERHRHIFFLCYSAFRNHLFLHNDHRIRRDKIIDITREGKISKNGQRNRNGRDQ